MCNQCFPGCSALIQRDHKSSYKTGGTVCHTPPPTPVGLIVGPVPSIFRLVASTSMPLSLSIQSLDSQTRYGPLFQFLNILRNRASVVTQMVKNLPAMQETWVQSLGWEDPLEKGVATNCSILAWKIPWTEEPSQLQSMGSQLDTTEQLIQE